MIEIKYEANKAERTRKIDESTAKLNLVDLEITSINLDFLIECGNIETIDISGNKIEELDLFPFANLSKLKRLNLSRNMLKKLDLSPLSNCKELTDINLSRNQFSEINLNSLIASLNLKTLDLSKNQLYSINLEIVHFLPNLINIYLSDNQFKEIDLKPLSLCPRLKTLDISGNNFVKLDLTPLTNIYSLSKLFLDEDNLIVATLETCIRSPHNMSGGLRFYYQRIKERYYKLNRKRLFDLILNKYSKIRVKKLVDFLGFSNEAEAIEWINKQKNERFTIDLPFLVVIREENQSIDETLNKLMKQLSDED